MRLFEGNTNEHQARDPGRVENVQLEMISFTYGSINTAADLQEIVIERRRERVQSVTVDLKCGLFSEGQH